MSNSSTFATERIPLAVYLQAANVLKFLRCERTGPTRACFVFDDPDSQGEHLEYQFDQGALIEARAVPSAQKLLRRQMFAVLGN